MTTFRLPARYFVWLLLWGCAALAKPVVDDRGRTIDLAKAPQRVISLLPSLTETICALGQCARLVGVDRYSNFPESVKNLPKAGGGLDPNIEAIVALKPDVVFMATSARAAERLEALGVVVVALEPQTHAGVHKLLGQVADVLQVGNAEAVWADLDAQVQAITRALPASVRGTQVYFEASSGPYAAGESSFIGETLARLGVQNIVPKSLGPFPKLNPEFVVRANPDVIMLGEHESANLANRPGWAAIKAVQQGRICSFTSTEGDAIVRAGPRLAEAAQIMARCLTTKPTTSPKGKPQ